MRSCANRSQEELFLQLLGAAGLLDRGMEVIRLQSGKLKVRRSQPPNHTRR